MEKYDVKKAFKHLYAPGKKAFAVVDVPRLQFLAIDGEGNPNTATSYAEAIQALYATSYGLKFESKRELGRDFVVAPLEGLWHAEDMETFVRREKDSWQWTMMIHQPDWIDEELVQKIIAMVEEKKGLPGLDKLRLMPFDEGLSVQILHIGSYDDEGPRLEEMHHRYMPEHGLVFNGHHHEIYLSDARRVPAEKLRTVLRQPVRERE